MAPPQSDPLKVVSKVSRSVRLDGVRQTRGSFLVEVLPDPAPPPPADLGSRFAFEKSVAGEFLVSRVSFTLQVQQAGTPPLHRVSVTGTIELFYKMAATFTEEELDSFAKINGIYHAWPYWREFVQSSTARAGLPGLTLHPIQANEAAVMAGLAPQPTAAAKSRSGKSES